MRTLTIDDAAVARLATEHLIALGHRRIAHIGGDLEFDLDFHLPTNRRVGYEGALRDAGIEVDPRLFAPADFTIQGGYQAAKQLLGARTAARPRSSPPPMRWRSASILAARDLGLVVPRDVSIIGIDDHDLADFFGLSTVAQFPRAQGEKAVEMLMDELEPSTPDAPAPAATPLPFELIVRSSARPARRQRRPATSARGGIAPPAAHDSAASP